MLEQSQEGLLQRVQLLAEQLLAVQDDLVQTDRLLANPLVLLRRSWARPLQTVMASAGSERIRETTAADRGPPGKHWHMGEIGLYREQQEQRMVVAVVEEELGHQGRDKALGPPMLSRVPGAFGDEVLFVRELFFGRAHGCVPCV
jgi:hypothetical protein